MPKPKSGTVRPTVVPRERSKDGRPKPDTSMRDRSAPALVRRIMDEAVIMGLDKRVATVLGRLQLEGVLTETQMAAGLLYAELVGQHERIKGHPPRAARSPSFEGGFDSAPTLDLEALARMDPDAAEKIEAKIKRRIRRIEKRYALAEVCLCGPADANPIDTIEGKRGRSRFASIVATLVEEVCCNDRPINSVHYGTLRSALSRLAIVCFKLNETEQKAKKNARAATTPDAKLLAEGAVDAIAEWFRKRSGTVSAFRIAQAQAWQPRRIAAYGRSQAGAELEHEIKVPRGSLMAAVIDAQLLTAAQAKGWTEVKITKEVA